MSKRVQPGGRVDERLYNQFRQFVRDRHGSVRGNLGTDLENAMRQYMNDEYGGDQLTRIENDIATLKAHLAEVEADGGTTARTLSTDQSTHTHPNETDTEPSAETLPRRDDSTDTDETVAKRNDERSRTVPTEPPHPKATRAEKAAFLAGQFDGKEAVHKRDHLAAAVERVYSFGEDATAALVEATVERIGHLVEHPRNPDILIKPDERERLINADEQERRAQAEREFESIDDEGMTTGAGDTGELDDGSLD